MCPCARERVHLCLKPFLARFRPAPCLGPLTGPCVGAEDPGAGPFGASAASASPSLWGPRRLGFPLSPAPRRWRRGPCGHRVRPGAPGPQGPKSRILGQIYLFTAKREDARVSAGPSLPFEIPRGKSTGLGLIVSFLVGTLVTDPTSWTSSLSLRGPGLSLPTLLWSAHPKWGPRRGRAGRTSVLTRNPKSGNRAQGLGREGLRFQGKEHRPGG